MLNHSACFRRFVGHKIPSHHSVVIELLERQRHRTGKVRAYINDPQGSLTQLLIDYVNWHQSRLTHRDAIIFTNKKKNLSPLSLKQKRTRILSARSYMAARGCCRPISQILILGADKYSKNLDNILAVTASFLSGDNSILIIVGNANQNSRFAQLFNRWTEQAYFFQTISEHAQIPSLPQPRKHKGFSIFISVTTFKSNTKLSSTGYLQPASIPHLQLAFLN